MTTSQWLLEDELLSARRELRRAFDQTIGTQTPEEKKRAHNECKRYSRAIKRIEKILHG